MGLCVTLLSSAAVASALLRCAPAPHTACVTLLHKILDFSYPCCACTTCLCEELIYAMSLADHGDNVAAISFNIRRVLKKSIRYAGDPLLI